jgi:hypothetical protein
MTAETNVSETEIVIRVQIPRYLLMRGDLNPANLAEQLGRLCEVELPLLATGTSEDTLMRRVGRNFPISGQGGSWPPPEAHP